MGLLSSSAFKLNSRRYTVEDARANMLSLYRDKLGRGLHSFASQLNLSAFNDIGVAHRGCEAHVKGVLGGV